MASIFDALLDDTDNFTDPVRRQAVAAALRKQQNYGTLGQLMGVEPTTRAGEAMQQSAQGSLKMAMAKQQTAKEAATASARQAVEDERWNQGFDQRERGIEATRINQAAGLDLRRQAAANAADAAASRAETTGLLNETRQQTILDKQETARKPIEEGIAAGGVLLRNLEQLKLNPALDSSVGVGGMLRRKIPRSKELDFDTMEKRLLGNNFMIAFQSLKGGGPITDIEGEKATQAMIRINKAQSPDDYRAALGELEQLVGEIIQRRREEAGRRGLDDLSTAPEAPPVDSPTQDAPQVPQGMDAAPIAVYDANGKRVQ